MKGLSGFFKVLLWRRAIQLRPRETEGLIACLFLLAVTAGREGLGPFVNMKTGALGREGWSVLFSSGETFSQSTNSWKLGLEGDSSETLKVVLRSRVGRARGVEQFCKAEGPRGTRLLMTVAGQTREEGEGEEALSLLGVLGSEDGWALGREPLLRQGRKDWRWRFISRFGAGRLPGSSGVSFLFFSLVGFWNVFSEVQSGSSGVPRVCVRPFSCFAMVLVTGPQYPEDLDSEHSA